MCSLILRLGRVLIGLAILGLATPLWAAKPVKVKAELANECMNCATDQASPGTVGPYSMLSDGSSYDNTQVRSEILANNSVYTLDTTMTLVNGLVGPGTRTAQMHFYSPVEGKYPGHVLPPCWNGEYDQDQAVNWSVFASNSVKFPGMQLNVPYPGFSRVDFNVRNGTCDNQIFRFYLRHYDVCIVRTSLDTWEVTSDSCGRQTNYGEANLRGQGGRKKQTVDYGDWRLPFKLILTKE